MYITVFANQQAQALRKPWTQVYVASISEQEFRSICCDNDNACLTSKLDYF